MISSERHSVFIKQTATRLGFDFCAIAKAAYLDEEARKLESWLQQGMHGKMQYMENHFDLRTDPTKLVPGAKSVITLLLNYFPETAQPDHLPKIAKYAYGEDYHDVIKEKIKTLHLLLKEEIGDFHGRGFVDSAPVLERAWAVKSGLGWVGKNGNLIHKKQGSFFFIATLIIDVELAYDMEGHSDYCGTCTRCIDNCPTEAILPGKVVDASKCISYFNIELKDALLPETLRGKMDDWMFGCDVCQDVCPWNRFSQPHRIPELHPLPVVFNFSLSDWEALTEENFKQVLKNSPIKRTKYSGIQRNINFIKKV
ncbi:MAG: tRNA epoxyqueuosine(34) reductase QueG [Ferruginibacter sp.]